MTKDSFEHALREGKVEATLHDVPVEAGNSIFIPSGRLHAIGEGNVIVEIQQNSDTTYRVFDWNRVGLDGQPRALHIDESMVSTDFADFEPDVDRLSGGTLAECPYFKVDKMTLSEAVPAVADGRFAIYTVLSGAVSCGETTFRPGSFFLVPASMGDARITPVEGSAQVLRSTLPVA